VGVKFFLNETQAREYTGQPTAGKKDEKGNIIQRGPVAAQGGSGFLIEKLLKVAEESGKAQSASVRADLMEHDKLVNEKIEKIAVAQQAFFEQQKEHERLEPRSVRSKQPRARRIRSGWRSRCRCRWDRSRCQ
jgi:hypothetical protein